MYPENDYRTYLEHSAKGQTWSKHKYLYITPGGRYVYPEVQTAKRVENSFRSITKKKNNRPVTVGHAKKYNTVTAPDGSDMVTRVRVAKGRKLGTYSKVGNSRVFEGARDGILSLDKIKIGGKKKPRTRPKTQRKKRITSGYAKIEYWT